MEDLLDTAEEKLRSGGDGYGSGGADDCGPVLDNIVLIRGLLEKHSQVMAMVPVEHLHQQRSTECCVKKLIRGIGPMLRHCS